MTKWLTHFKALVESAGLPWHEPHTAVEGTETSHEWWVGSKGAAAFERKVTVYEEPKGELLCVWGHDIALQMSSAPLNDDVALLAGWAWLTGDE